MELNFERIEMQKWNIPTDRAERVDGQNGFICLVIMFTLRVMVIKMSKMAHFLYFQLIPAKNQSQFKCIFTCIWKILFSSLGKMLWIVGSWATISNTSTLEDKDFHYFLLTQQFFYISTVDVSETVTLKTTHYTIFWKNSKRSFRCTF